MANYLVLTGGSRGIGKHTLSHFHRAGWHIINISRHDADIAQVKNFNIDLGASDWASKHETALREAVAGATKICLVHNAAAFRMNSVATLSDQELRSDLEINVVAPTLLNRIFLPHMQPGSSIIYIGSTLAEIGVSNRASYIISKHAIVGLMRATCQDLTGKNISTCCICPGFVDTEMLHGQADPKILAALIKNKVTAGRLILPSEIADLIYYCAEHPILNGSVIHANLGQVAS